MRSVISREHPGEQLHQTQQEKIRENDVAPALVSKTESILDNRTSCAASLHAQDPSERSISSEPLSDKGNTLLSMGTDSYLFPNKHIPTLTSLMQDVHQLRQDGDELLHQLHRRLNSTAAAMRDLLSEIDGTCIVVEKPLQSHAEEALSVENKLSDQWPQQLVLEEEVSACRQLLEYATL